MLTRHSTALMENCLHVFHGAWSHHQSWTVTAGVVLPALRGFSFHSTGTKNCTSVLRFNGDEAFSLWPEALGGVGLHFELVWDILTQVGHSQGGFQIVSFDIDCPGLP